MTRATDAEAIYQVHLDRVTHAIWSRAFHLGLREMAFPNVRTSQAGEIVLTDPADMIREMAAFRDLLRDMDADDYGRRCLVAGFHPCEPDRIDGAHRTYILRRGKTVRPAYVSALTLRCRDGVWRSDTRVLDTVPHAAVLYATPSAPLAGDHP